MKKILLICTAFICISVLTFGQSTSNKIDIIFGKKHDKPFKNYTSSKVIDADDTGFYQLWNVKTGKKMLSYHNYKTDKAKWEEIDLKYKGKKREFMFTIAAKDKLYFFTAYRDGTARKKYLYVESINRTTLKSNKDVKKISELDFSENKKLASKPKALVAGGHRDVYFYNLSSDSSKILIYYDLLDNKTNNEERLSMHVFNSDNMEEDWHKEISLPIPDKRYNVMGYEVSNIGNVFVLGKYKSVGESISKEASYSYRIFGFLDKGKILKNYQFSTEDYRIPSMKISVNDNNDILCGGFYSNYNSKDILGSCFVKIDGNTEEILAKKFEKFSLDIIEKDLWNKAKKAQNRNKQGKDTGSKSIRANELILTADGGALLFGEQYHMAKVSSNYSTAGFSSYSRSYYTNNIIVVRIALNGDVEWSDVIAKKQTASHEIGLPYISYGKVIIGDKLYITFNDNLKNLNNNGEEKVVTYIPHLKKSYVALVEIDKNGKQTKKMLPDAIGTVHARESIKISENELLLFGSGDFYPFAKVTLKE